MQMLPTQLDNVHYNASTQRFEALVTVHESGRAKRYACEIDAPITMTYEDAVSGLATQALRRHRQPRGLQSEIMRQLAVQRARRAKFDLRGWLQGLVPLTGHHPA